MKEIFISVILFLTSAVQLFASDILVLKNGDQIDCTINEIDEYSIQYLIEGQENQQVIAANEVLYLQIDRKNRSLIRKLKKRAKNKLPLEQVDLCHQGIMDANTFHKRAAGNFALGFFFGAFGVIGTAIGNPRLPHYYPIGDPTNLSSPTYMQCYQRRARGKNIGNAAIGWGAAIVLVIVLTPTIVN